MAQVNKDALKKHHFWIIAGLVPIMILIAVILIWTGVGGAIASGEAAIKTAYDGGKAKSPKGMGVQNALTDQKGVVASKKDKLWEFNWNDQKELFTWPVDDAGKLANFLRDPKDPNYAKDPKSASILKFGDPLPNDNFQYQKFIEPAVYRKAYDVEATKIQPTQFVGGAWQNVLRYVPNWSEKLPDSWMLWLALEDLWVQRGVLEPISNVTKTAGLFQPVDEKGPDGKTLPAGLKRTFVSRLWQIDLEVKSEGPRKYLTGKIKNITDRVQLLGIGNMMRLDVYFDDQTVPFPFIIEGEFVEAGKQVPILYVPLNHDIPPNLNPTSIVKLEQIFDARTVPVKRIDQIIIGKTDNRHATAQLKSAKFVPEPAVKPSAGGGDGGGGGDGFAGPGGKGFGGGAPSGPPPGAGGGGGAPAESDLEAYFASYKLRYLETTDQVRRIPVAIVMVVDSMYLQDVLASYSNSKLRFQVSQIHYKRFRDKLSIPNAPGSGSSGGMFSGGGGSETMFSGGFGGGEEGGGSPKGGGGLSPRGNPGGPGGGLTPRGTPGGPGGGGGLSPRGLPGGPGGSSDGGGGGPPRSQMPRGSSGGPSGGGGMMGMGDMFGGMGMMSSSGVAESQTAAGLIELTIYGVVSLYDRFGTVAPADANAATTSTPAEPATPKAPAPAKPENPPAPTPTPPAGTPSTPMTPGSGNDPKPNGKE